MTPSLHHLCAPRHVALALVLREAARMLFASIRSWFDTRRRARRLRSDQQALHALDEFTLHDLGLHRSEIDSLMNTAQRSDRRHHVV